MRLRRGKFNNLKSDGFDSKKEAAFAQKLELLRSAACDSQRVVSVEKQVPFVLIGVQRDKDGRLLERSCKYVADFVVEYADGRRAVFDVKGYRTPEYIIKRKLMLFVHGIRRLEV